MTNDKQVLVRLPSAVVDELDEIADSLAHPGSRFPRAAVIRGMVVKALEERKRRGTKKAAIR